jgi:hypothetical protein
MQFALLVSAERPALYEARPASFREADVDDIEVPRYDRLGEDRTRLARDLGTEVAVRQVREGEHAHLRRARELRDLGCGGVQRLVGPLLLFRRERGFMDEQVGALCRLEDDASGTRIAGDDDLATGPGRPEYLLGLDVSAVRRRDGLAGLETAEERALRHAEGARGLDVEATRPIGLDERVPVRVHAVLDLEGLDPVVAAVEPVARP